MAPFIAVFNHCALVKLCSWFEDYHRTVIFQYLYKVFSEFCETFLFNNFHLFGWTHVSRCKPAYSFIV